MTLTSTASEDRRPRVGWGFRMACHLAGVDHQRIADCPLGDKQFAGRIGLQLVASSTFLFAIFSSSLLIGFGGDMLSNAIVLAMALVAAAVVLLLDIGIVQSDFHHHGLELARDRGFGTGNPHWARSKRFATVGLRLALSMTIAFAFATFFELRLFGADIARQMETNYRSANAELFRDVQTAYDQSVGEIEAEISRDNARLDVLADQETEIKGKLFGTGNADPEIDTLLQTIARLTAAKQVADAEALRRSGDAVNELYGVKETADQSGAPGDGPLRKTAVARAALAEQESARLAQEISAAQAQLAALRARLSSEAKRGSANLTDALQRMAAETASVRAGKVALIQKRENMIADREAAVVAIAQARPEYVPRTDGFLARVEALETLKQRPAVWWIAFWTTLVIMAIEISAVLSKVFFSVPTRYAVRTALDFEDAVAGMIQGRSAHEAEAESIKKDIEIEGLRAEFLAKRASRLSREAALSKLYSDGPERSAS